MTRHDEISNSTGAHTARSPWEGPPSNMTVDFANLPEQPSFPAAESAVLGAVMLSPTSADKLLPILREDHFTSAPHRDTLAAVRALWDRKQPIDPVLIHDQLRKDGHLKWGETKAALFIHECVEATYFPGNGMSYAATLLEYAARRRLVQAGVRIAQAAATARIDLHDVVMLVAGEIQRVADDVTARDIVARTATSPTRLTEAIDDVATQLEDAPRRTTLPRPIRPDLHNQVHLAQVPKAQGRDLDL